MGKRSGFTVTGLILKRTSVGEADRIVTLFTPDQGKVVCVAKGARKLTSSQRGSLEPGNLVKAMIIPTQSLWLLTQTTLISDLGDCWKDLAQLRRVSQILEITDKLVAEADPDPELFILVSQLLTRIIKRTASDIVVRDQLDSIIQHLGFPTLAESQHQSISDYVSELTDREIKSFKYLKVE